MLFHTFAGGETAEEADIVCAGRGTASNANLILESSSADCCNSLGMASLDAREPAVKNESASEDSVRTDATELSGERIFPACAGL